MTTSTKKLQDKITKALEHLKTKKTTARQNAQHHALRSVELGLIPDHISDAFIKEQNIAREELRKEQEYNKIYEELRVIFSDYLELDEAKDSEDQ